MLGGCLYFSGPPVPHELVVSVKGSSPLSSSGQTASEDRAKLRLRSGRGRGELGGSGGAGGLDDPERTRGVPVPRGLLVAPRGPGPQTAPFSWPLQIN